MAEAKTEWLGDEPELEEAANAAALKAYEQDQDKAGSKADNELALLREQVLEERAKREKMEKAMRLWRDGDLGALPAESPCEVTVHQDDNDLSSQTVKVWVNGTEYAFTRGTPKQVPRFVVDVLSRAVIDAWTKIVDPVTDNPKLVRITKRRFDYSARPIFTETLINA